MQKARAISIGVIAAGVLEDHQGEIFAVFESSLYIKSKSTLACVCTCKLPQGPLNMVSDLVSIKHLHHGEHWRYENNVLQLGSYYQLHCSNTKIWEAPAIPQFPIYNRKLTDFTTHIADALSENEVEAKTNTAKLVKSRLQEQHLCLTQWLSDTSASPEELKHLLGCGDGLTPAADDMLLGAVVTLKVMKMEPAATLLADWIRPHAATNTSEISAAHLLAACEGLANELLHSLLVCLSKPDSTRQQLDHHINSLLNHGQSSGYYTLWGAWTVLNKMNNAQNTVRSHRF